MLGKGQQLHDDHQIMRYVPWSKLRKDGDDNVLGFLGSAFELRDTEEYLSVNWLEYYPGNHSDQIEQCIKEFRDAFGVRRKSAFGVANVRKVKDLAQSNGKAIRIVYTPSQTHPSHTSIQKLPRNELSLFEALAADAFTEMILNSEIP